MSEEEVNQDDKSTYQPPKVKSLDEIKSLDVDDESLRKYKEILLVPDDSRICIPVGIKVVSSDKVLTEFNIKDATKEKPIVELTEGSKYHLELQFYVQREICCGVKFVHQVNKGVLKVDKDVIMLGSFAPKPDLQTWISPECEAPKGMLFRGQYNVTSTFEDDDKNKHASFEWILKIVKG